MFLGISPKIKKILDSLLPYFSSTGIIFRYRFIELLKQMMFVFLFELINDYDMLLQGLPKW